MGTSVKYNDILPIYSDLNNVFFMMIFFLYLFAARQRSNWADVWPIDKCTIQHRTNEH